jgi:glutamate receptor ionotropic, NMDA 2B
MLEVVHSMIFSELHAFLYDAVVLDYLSGQDDGCKLRVVGNWYAMTGYGIGFPKQSKFKDMINKEIIDMHHSGMRSIDRYRIVSHVSV